MLTNVYKYYICSSISFVKIWCYQNLFHIAFYNFLSLQIIIHYLELPYLFVLRRDT